MMRRAPHGDIELMSKKEVLDFEPAPRLEQAGDKRPKEVKDGNHRMRSCADSASPCESRRIEFSGTTAASSALALSKYAKAPSVRVFAGGVAARGRADSPTNAGGKSENSQGLASSE
jgi:hypothetical protein